MGKKKGMETKQSMIQTMIDVDYILDRESLFNKDELISKYDLLTDNREASRIDNVSYMYNEVSHHKIGTLFILKYNKSLKKNLYPKDHIDTYGYMNKIDDVKDLLDIRYTLLLPGIYFAQLDKNDYMVLYIERPDESNFSTKHTIKIYFIGKKHLDWVEKYYSFYKKYDDILDSVEYDTFIDKQGPGTGTERTIFKSFDQMVFPEKEHLINYINNFIDNIPSYYQYGMTPKLSILLYGKYGTGKSTTCQALAKLMKIESIKYRHADQFRVTVGPDGKTYNARPERSDYYGREVIHCIDDIDCICNSREDDDSTENKATLQKLLAFLDNPSTFYYKAKDGKYYPISVIVATTNFYEKLDPAVRRHGRFDLQIEMKDLSHKDAKELCNLYNLSIQHVLGKDYLGDKSKDEWTISPAYLQAKCMEKIDTNLKSTDAKDKPMDEVKEKKNETKIYELHKHGHKHGHNHHHDYFDHKKFKKKKKKKKGDKKR